MFDSLERLGQLGLLPLAAKATPENARDLALALVRAGIGAVDLPIQTEDFEAVAHALLSASEEMVLAVSQLRTLEDCQRAVDAGARILLSLTLSEEQSCWCRERSVALVPCCVTPSEIDAALKLGHTTVFYTPCSSVEPCAQLFELYKQQGLRMIVSGGIDQTNHLSFADKLYITAVRGSFLCPKSLVDTGSWDALTAHVSGLYHEMLGFELGHVGINTADDSEGHRLADEIADVFGNPAEHGHVGNWDLFRGIEVVNGKGPGVHGHIAVQCNNLIRAMYYLESKGHLINRDSFRFRYPGRLSFAYLQETFGGFAIHLMLRWTAP